jgi:hypothetical protein
VTKGVLGHAAVPALLEWYLIEPPPLQNPWWSRYWPWSIPHQWNLDAPLSVRDLKECKDELAATNRANADYMTSSIQAWQCVTSDDPRLDAK